MKRGPLALFTGGATGAGKSVLAERVAAVEPLVSLDLDLIQAALVHLRPRRSPGSLRPLALRLLDRWQGIAIARRAPLLINTTAADLPFVTALRERLVLAGYRPAMVFVVAGETECRHRNRARPLPRPAEAEQRFQQIRNNLPSLESQFDHFLCVENHGSLPDWHSAIERVVLPWVRELA